MQREGVMLTIGELKTLSAKGPLWGKSTDADLYEAEKQGLIKRLPEGWVITCSGENAIASADARNAGKGGT